MYKITLIWGRKGSVPDKFLSLVVSAYSKLTTFLHHAAVTFSSKSMVAKLGGC